MDFYILLQLFFLRKGNQSPHTTRFLTILLHLLLVHLSFIQFLQKWYSIVALYTYREINQVAYSLAKYGCQMDSSADITVFVQLAPFVQTTLADDRSGTLFVRQVAPNCLPSTLGSSLIYLRDRMLECGV